MDLWIRSQDKEVLQKITSLFVNDDGYIFSYDYINSNEVFLGKYKTKERALEVLDEIDEFIDLFNRKGFGNVLSDDGVHSKHTVYQMPKE